MINRNFFQRKGEQRFKTTFFKVADVCEMVRMTIEHGENGGMRETRYF